MLPAEGKEGDVNVPSQLLLGRAGAARPDDLMAA